MTTRRALIRTTPALGILAACGTGAQQPIKATELPAEMSWMGWSMSQEFLVPAYEEAAKAFSAKHPASKMVMLPAGGDYRVKYNTLAAAGTPPDVADMHWQQHVRDVGPGGLAMELTPFLKKDAYPKDYFGWEPYAWQKKQYGIPLAIQSTGLFYNQALFDQAGVKYPDATWTWDQYLQAAQRLTKPGPDDANTIWGSGDQGGTNVGWMSSMFEAFGGGFFTSDFKAPRFSDAATIAAMEYRAALQARHKVTPNLKTGGASGQFTGGKIAMVTSGSWFVANVKRATTSALNTGKVPWDVAPLPKGPKRAAGLTAELGIGIPTGVKNPDASWAGVRHLTSKEGIMPFVKVERYIPPLRTLWNDTIPADGSPKGFKVAFLDQWEKLETSSPFLPDFQQIIPAWEEEGGKVWMGERPAREGASTLQRLFEEYLAKLKREGKL
ncbi:MAG TPA: sugar ABC transporter substrate-binding protein [Chloroflexota bacterium]|nr:sugar ABC transporter substrate-binding protein [Chloroflexota bacterium]